MSGPDERRSLRPVTDEPVCAVAVRCVRSPGCAFGCAEVPPLAGSRYLPSTPWVAEPRSPRWLLRRLREAVRERLPHRALEVWHRHDVGGHALGCPRTPMVPAGDEPGVVRCGCFASTWRRVWPRP